MKITGSSAIIRKFINMVVVSCHLERENSKVLNATMEFRNSESNVDKVKIYESVTYDI